LRSPRGIDKAVLLSLAGCGWLRKHHNLIITGPTGTGKGCRSAITDNNAT
jgi:DNA replication protein DnaC